MGYDEETVNAPMPTLSPRTRAQRGDTCTDQVVGAILSGWRYDISGISPDLRLDYEAHLHECAHCRRRQRIHRTVDVLLLAATTLSFAAFLLAALVTQRLEDLRRIAEVHMQLHGEGFAALAHLPGNVTPSLQAVAVAGMVVSLLLWTLVIIATPIPSMLSGIFRERISPELRERLRKQTA